MAITAPAQLSSEDVEILLALWHDVYGDRKSNQMRSRGLTRRELEGLLVHGASDEPYRSIQPIPVQSEERDQANRAKPFKTRSALNKHLTALKKLANSAPGLHDRQMIRTGSTSARGPNETKAKVGAHRDVYALAENELVTWPETARIAMEVWNSQGHHVVEDVLINQILSLQLKRGPEPKASLLDRRGIVEDIRFLIDRNYLVRYNQKNIMADHHGSRLRFEAEFLYAIANFSNQVAGAPPLWP